MSSTVLVVTAVDLVIVVAVYVVELDPAGLFV